MTQNVEMVMKQIGNLSIDEQKESFTKSKTTRIGLSSSESPIGATSVAGRLKRKFLPQSRRVAVIRNHSGSEKTPRNWRPAKETMPVTAVF